MAKRRIQSTQKYLPFKSIKEGAVVMKDGSLRAILMANSINFNLKSTDEKMALLSAYQNFLNSLSFSIQIVVQSRTLNLDEYLNKLETISKTQPNTLLRTQTEEYVSFVNDLIGVANIMSKTFYVVVDYKPHLQVQQGFFSRLFSRKPITPKGRFDEAKDEIVRRAGLVANGLTPLGIDSILLNTEELIDLFYTTYNPDIAQKQKLFNVSSVDADIITTLSKETK